MKILGIILIVLGIISFAYQGITYTKKEKIIDIGPIEATKEEKKTIPLPPILGGLLVAGGVIVLVAGSRKST
jgi:amino acid transporter